MAHQPLWSKLDSIYKLPLKSFFIQQKQKGNLSEASSRVCFFFQLDCYRRIQIKDSEAFSLTQIQISFFLHLYLSFSFFLHHSNALVLLVSSLSLFHSFLLFTKLRFFFVFFLLFFSLSPPLIPRQVLCLFSSIFSDVALSSDLNFYLYRCLFFFRFASHFFTLPSFLHSLSLSFILCAQVPPSLLISFFTFSFSSSLYFILTLSLRLTFPKTYLQR